MSANKNILVLTYWSFNDALIQAYTLPYVYIIQKQLPPRSKIFLVTLEQTKFKMSASERKKATAQLKQQNIYLLDFNYRKFGIRFIFSMIIFLLHLLMTVYLRNIKYIHAWCMPAGALGYMLSKITGKPLVIDSYEPHAEAMVENNTWKRSSIKFHSLFYFEKKLSKHASVLICAASGMRYYAKEKYMYSLKRFYVKPACVDKNLFSANRKKKLELRTKLKLENKIVCVYAGKFGGIYLDKEVFDFFRVAQNYWSNKFKVVLLTPHSEWEVKELARVSNFNAESIIIKFVNHREVPDYIALADFAISPVKPIKTKRFCTPIKNGEYWAMGLPVVITKNISDDSEIINKNNIGAVISELSEKSYKEAIVKIDTLIHSNDIENISLTIEQIAIHYRDYSIAEKIYHDIYKNTA